MGAILKFDFQKWKQLHFQKKIISTTHKRHNNKKHQLQNLVTRKLRLELQFSYLM